MRETRARPRRRGCRPPDRCAPRERLGAAGRTRGTCERIHDLRSPPSRSDTSVTTSEVAHHDPTCAHHDALESHVAHFRSAPPQRPRLRLPSPPPTSALLIASLVPSSWSSCCYPSLARRRPASGLPPFTPGLPCPVFVRKTRRKAESAPEAGRRPVDLQASTPRNQHREINPAPLVQVRARSVRFGVIVVTTLGEPRLGVCLAGCRACAPPVAVGSHRLCLQLRRR